MTDAAATPPVLYVEDGPVARITLNRPDKLNALNPQVFSLLEDALGCFADGGARIAVLTGAGRAFAAGADIEHYVDIDLHDYIRFMQNGRRVYDGLATCPKPIVAAVRGYALGGGFELVLACDLVVAASDARFGLPEAKLGLLPGGGGTQRLPRLIGRMRANDVLMTGRLVSAAEAHAWGLVSRLVEPDELEAATRQLVDEILAVAPLAANLAKRLTREGSEAPLATGISLEESATAALMATQDAREGIAAFVEKRRAAFEGR